MIMLVGLHMLGAFVFGFISAILFLKFLRRRCYRSQFYPQRWYWFVSRNMHVMGYPNWLSKRFLDWIY